MEDFTSLSLLHPEFAIKHVSATRTVKDGVNIFVVTFSLISLRIAIIPVYVAKML
jgi:hypothetical protein